MKAVFMGTPDFAVPSLVALHEGGWQVVGVYCQPDKPAGRGMKLTPPAVKVKAEALGLRVFQPAKLRDPAVLAELAALEPDVIVVAAYGKILPKAVLDLPRLGCINVHASMLPRLRGAAPIHHAILNGDRETGITIMKMDEGLDTGDMVIAESRPIDPRETTGSLHDKLARLGASLLLQGLHLREIGHPTVQQDHARHTLAPKIAPDAGCIDWSKAGEVVDRHIRGMTPFPGAFTFLEGKRLRVHDAVPVDASGEPGAVLRTSPDEGIVVACGTGALAITRLQPEGKKPMAAREFLAGHKIVSGTRLGAS